MLAQTLLVSGDINSVLYPSAGATPSIAGTVATHFSVQSRVVALIYKL